MTEYPNVLVLSATIVAAEVYHEILPPINYSLIPRWVVFAAAFATLCLAGWLVWWIKQRAQRELPPKLPRDRALEALEQIEQEVDHINPYEFSIRVSDILRSYVTEQYGVPSTRQTSVEFLEKVARNSQFSAEEKMLLEDFLSRCDLIKFARYHATPTDSRLLLDEAVRFLRGGEVVPVS